MSKHFVVSDAEIVLFLWPLEEGGYAITSPLDDRLHSQAQSLEEAFEMGHDALAALAEYDHREKQQVAARDAAKRPAHDAAAKKSIQTAVKKRAPRGSSRAS